MNERIKELAEKAYDNWREQDEIDANYQDSFEEEFAQLIVKDFIKNLSWYGYENAIAQIKYHAARKYNINLLD